MNALCPWCHAQGAEQHHPQCAALGNPFMAHVTECLGNTAATVRAWRKPHLRLHYTVTEAPNNPFRWYIEYVRGPNTRARRHTFGHNSAKGAGASAKRLWF